MSAVGVVPIVGMVPIVGVVLIVGVCHERTPRESGRAAREVEEVESG